MIQNIFENKKMRVRRCLEQNGAISLIFIVIFLTETLMLFTFTLFYQAGNQ
jgi:hypothetical protein